MTINDLTKAVVLLFRGEWRRVYNEVHVRIYRWIYEVIFVFARPSRVRGRRTPPEGLSIETAYPVAFESPDHVAPKGTALNNSTNKKFVLRMDELLYPTRADGPVHFLDLGCAGGQLVKDFLRLHWLAAGLEGSDFSLKKRRANWRTLANKNLFTGDITKPFQMTLKGAPVKFHLITAWEVLEHIATPDLEGLFNNISIHLEEGGYFIASTSSLSDIHNGIELHQTRWTNQEWRSFVEPRHLDLEPMDVGLKIYQYVRCTFLNPSFLIYRKKAAPAQLRMPEKNVRSAKWS
jgi:SAM-dependent methyltransferase